MDAAGVFIDRLERLLAANRSPEVMLGTLRGICDAALLWEVAERVCASPEIMQAVYRRALELEASEETARGYVALSYYLTGDFDLAASMVSAEALESHDPVLLSVWAALGESSTVVIHRLQEALKKAPNPLRLWRQLGTEALREGRMHDARLAYQWLADNEDSQAERERVALIIQRYGW